MIREQKLGVVSRQRRTKVIATDGDVSSVRIHGAAIQVQFLPPDVLAAVEKALLTDNSSTAGSSPEGVSNSSASLTAPAANQTASAAVAAAAAAAAAATAATSAAQHPEQRKRKRSQAVSELRKLLSQQAARAAQAEASSLPRAPAATSQPLAGSYDDGE
jgi:triphosphoribosyl-dephospho-CoA synthase